MTFKSSIIYVSTTGNNYIKMFWEELITYFPFTANLGFDMRSGAKLYYVCVRKSIKQQY
jgi:hypothetical protein